MPTLTPGPVSGGLLISLEGGDGTGKSTQFRLLVEDLKTAGWPVVSAREPGGTPVSEKIRRILLDPANEGMRPETEAMLFAASRAQLVRQVVGPALEAGSLVVLDRYVDSSLVYQGRALGITGFVTTVNGLATGGLLPDLTLLFDVDPAKAGKYKKNGATDDRIERRDAGYHRTVREAFLELARNSGGRMVVVDAARPIQEVHAEVMGLVWGRLSAKSNHPGGGCL